MGQNKYYKKIQKNYSKNNKTNNDLPMKWCQWNNSVGGHS